MINARLGNDLYLLIRNARIQNVMHETVDHILNVAHGRILEIFLNVGIKNKPLSVEPFIVPRPPQTKDLFPFKVHIFEHMIYQFA